MLKRIPRRVRILAAATVTITITTLLVLFIAHRWTEVAAALTGIDPGALVGLALIMIPTIGFRSEVWCQILRQAGSAAPRELVWGASGSSFIFNHVNIILGAAIKMTLLRKVAPGMTPSLKDLAISEMPLIWIEGLLAMLMLIVTATVTGVPWWMLGGLCGALAAVLVAMRRINSTRATDSLAITADPRRLAIATGLMATTWALQLIRLWWALDLVGLDVDPFGVVVTFVVAGILSSLPVGPGSGPAALLIVYSNSSAALASAAGLLMLGTSFIGTVAFALLFAPILLRAWLHEHRSRRSSAPAEASFR